MKRWILTIESGTHRKDGFKRNEKQTMVYEGNEMFDVAKKIWLDHFRYGDNIDDYGTCKIGDNRDGIKHEIWTVARETKEGEFRGIFRLDLEE